MANDANIIIADESALFFYEHIESFGQCGMKAVRADPMAHAASNADELASFSQAHPLYGGEPVSLLVREPSACRQSRSLSCRHCPESLPHGSFYKLGDGLYIISPELLFARMGNLVSDVRLAEIGLSLCARYCLNLDTGSICDRRSVLTTPAKLSRYLAKAQGVRGAGKARRSLKWVVANSGSPMESKMMIQFAAPLWAGGFGLPFTHMNYDASAGRLASLAEQGEFCIDCVNPRFKVGLEYDGAEWHEDASGDKHRIDALSSLGWHVFSIGKSVLYDPGKTIEAASQVAHHLGLRMCWPSNWRAKFGRLRSELGLPS